MSVATSGKRGLAVRSTAFRRLRRIKDRINAGLRATESATALACSTRISRATMSANIDGVVVNVLRKQRHQTMKNAISHGISTRPQVLVCYVGRALLPVGELSTGKSARPTWLLFCMETCGRVLICGAVDIARRRRVAGNVGRRDGDRRDFGFIDGQVATTFRGLTRALNRPGGDGSSPHRRRGLSAWPN